MEAIDLNLEAPEPPELTGIGERLVAAREARGLDLGDIVRVLHLSASTLQALESSCYEKLPAPVFVHGYLRSYARLLGLDAEVLVAEYDRLLPVPETVPTPVIEARRKATVRHLYIRSAAVLVVLAVMVLLGSWWYNRPNQDIPDRSRTASEQAKQPASPVSVLPSPQTGESNPARVPPVALAPQAPPRLPANKAAGGSVAADKSATPLDKAVAEAGPVPSAVNNATVPANVDAVEQSRAPEAEVEPAVPGMPIAPLASEHGGTVRASRAPTGKEVISIKANDDSWAEVVDANGYQLMYDLLRPGKERRVQGQAPFQVFLGNAPAVELSLNHKRIDITPFRRKNSTARFTVDARL
jgi:cytoskeleton protein RodZ